MCQTPDNPAPHVQARKGRAAGLAVWQFPSGRGKWHVVLGLGEPSQLMHVSVQQFTTMT